MKRSTTRVLVSHLRRVGIRALAATLILWILVSFPFPLLPSQYFILIQVPVSIFAFLVYFGKLLYDTFFYDRYGQ
jgi:hypothetical protein